MSSELDTLVLESLAEGEKDAFQIRYWIAIHRTTDLPNQAALGRSLDKLEAAGLIEAYRQHLVPKTVSDGPMWVYRLTADGALEQWAGEVSIPKEMSPA